MPGGVSAAFFEGKKFEEIAEELDISESTARVQTHRGMEMLRQRFAEYDLAVILFLLLFFKKILFL